MAPFLQILYTPKTFGNQCFEAVTHPRAHNLLCSGSSGLDRYRGVSTLVGECLGAIVAVGFLVHSVALKMAVLTIIPCPYSGLDTRPPPFPSLLICWTKICIYMNSLRPWRWRQLVHLKCWQHCQHPHGAKAEQQNQHEQCNFHPASCYSGDHSVKQRNKHEAACHFVVPTLLYDWKYYLLILAP